MAKVKLRIVPFDPDKYYEIRVRQFEARKKKGGVCLACGAPLVDAVSKQRGYGPRCWGRVSTIVVLESIEQ